MAAQPVGHGQDAARGADRPKAATSSLGVSLCGERVVKTAAVPPGNSNDATSAIWASNSMAPSVRRRVRRERTPTAVGTASWASRGSVAPVLIAVTPG